MTYYYYDKVLVSNCRLNGLNSYAGKMTRNSVVQLSAQLVGQKDAVLAGPKGITFTGDFYQVVIPGKVTYHIHKGGNLIRAFAADFSAVEETVLGIPASILALLQGKLLLRGTLLHAGRRACALVGRSAEEQPREENVMIVRREEQYLGIVHTDSNEPDEGIEILELMGILVRKHEKTSNAIEPVDRPERRKNVLLKNVVGYRMFMPELQRAARESTLLEEAARELYMVSLRVK